MVDKPFPMDFTPQGRKLLEKITKASGLSRNNVIAHLALTYAHLLEFDEVAGVVFPGKAQTVLAIRIPKQAGAKLKAARKRTGKSYSDIGEALVRIYGLTAIYPVLPDSRSHTAPRRRASRRRDRR